MKMIAIAWWTRLRQLFHKMLAQECPLIIIQISFRSQALGVGSKKLSPATRKLITVRILICLDFFAEVSSGHDM